MDTELLAIAEFAIRAREDGVPARLTAEIVRHVVDAFGCAVAALGEPASAAARELAADTPVEGGASVIGLAGTTSVELAAFANAGLVRNLDFNDVYSSHSGGHPSNMFPGLLAVAEAAGLGGADVVLGIHVACEVYAALSDSVALRKSGWDAGAFLAPACAAGVAALLGASVAETANAVSLALTAGPPLGVIRSGTLSHWKGSAEAHAVMNGVFLARLARAGMTGPAAPFTGTSGFLQQVVRPVDVSRVGEPVDGRAAIERTNLKIVPSQWSSQGPVELFLELSRELRPERIEAIRVEAFDFLYFSIGGGRDDREDKWDPRTRETADHSLPYLLAVALTDGALTLDSFRTERILDPALRPLMEKVTIENADRFADAYPRTQPVDFTIRLTDGAELRRSTGFARGHFTNPLPDDEVDAKYRGLVRRIVADEEGERLLALLRGLPALDDLRPLGAALRAVRAPG